MGKRKTSKPPPKKPKPKLSTAFNCIFCGHEKSVVATINAQKSQGMVECSRCGVQHVMAITPLTEAVDIYADWVDQTLEVRDSRPLRLPNTTTLSALTRTHDAPSQTGEQVIRKVQMRLEEDSAGAGVMSAVPHTSRDSTVIKKKFVPTLHLPSPSLLRHFHGHSPAFGVWWFRSVRRSFEHPCHAEYLFTLSQCRTRSSSTRPPPWLRCWAPQRDARCVRCYRPPSRRCHLQSRGDGLLAGCAQHPR